MKLRRVDDQIRFGLMWFNSQTPYATSRVTAEANPDVLDVNVQMELARTAEQVGFDFLFYADGYIGHGEANARIGHGEPRLSAPVWAPVAMMATSHIGVATTLHTRYLPPAVIARLGANLDRLSGGRWAWNIVPGTKDDPLIGLPPLEHSQRYAHAAEAVRAVKAIWDAGDGEVDFEGEFYRFKGSMMGPRPVQKPYPLLFNAGVSPAGQDLIASECDYGFFAVVDDLDKVRGPVEQLAARAERHGRDPLEVNLVGSIGMVVGRTGEEARERLEWIRDNLDMEAARGWAHSFLVRSKTYQDTHQGDVDEVARSVGIAAGSTVLAGTAEEVAEQLLHIHRSTGLRGFQILPLMWSVEELKAIGEVFPHLAKAGVWTAPEDRGWSW
ncbi:LLM class flavin-dependent oxidoreductase [Streptomyces sp. NPDC004542]|uniref:LLM class flavin-dependent oxidoreductase n=1 Tax=Streptomyces sp. NPDC004542 TaxID=3154281 RepID=UPI0033A4DD01